MTRIFNKNGFASMVEIIVTSIIFMISSIGILSTVAMIGVQGSDSAKKLEAVYIGKGIIESLHDEVDADTWDTGGLAVGSPVPITSGMYTINYTVTNEGATGLRKLVMTITW